MKKKIFIEDRDGDDNDHCPECKQPLYDCVCGYTCKECGLPFDDCLCDEEEDDL